MIFLLCVIMTSCSTKNIIISSFDSTNYLKSYEAATLSRIRTETILSLEPTAEPTQPTTSPTFFPTTPTFLPSIKPTAPTLQPTIRPTRPTVHPTYKPSSPTFTPTLKPTHPTKIPTGKPTKHPSYRPTKQPLIPTWTPSSQPSSKPTLEPSSQPSSLPSSQPTGEPSQAPTTQPSEQPSFASSSQTLVSPSCIPSFRPSMLPSTNPSYSASTAATKIPSKCPNLSPSLATTSPTITAAPSKRPSESPTFAPTSPSTLTFQTKCPSVLPTSPSSLPSVLCPNSNSYSNYFIVFQTFSNLTHNVNISSPSGIHILADTAQSILPCVLVRFLGVSTGGATRLRKLSTATTLAYNVLFSSQGSSLNAEYTALSTDLTNAIISGLFTNRYREYAKAHADLDLASVAITFAPIISPYFIVTLSPSISPISGASPGQTTNALPVGAIAAIAAGGSLFIIVVVTIIFLVLRNGAEKEQFCIEKKQKEEQQDSNDELDGLEIPQSSNKSIIIVPVVEESKFDTPQLSPAISTNPSFSPDNELQRLTLNCGLNETPDPSRKLSPNRIRNTNTLRCCDKTLQILTEGVDPMTANAKSENLNKLPLPPLRLASAPPCVHNLNEEAVSHPPVPIITSKTKSGLSTSPPSSITSNNACRRVVKSVNPFLRRHSLTSSVASSSASRNSDEILQSASQLKPEQPSMKIGNLVVTISLSQSKSGVASECVHSCNPTKSTSVSARVEEFENLAKTQPNNFYNGPSSTHNSGDCRGSAKQKQTLDSTKTLRTVQDNELSSADSIMSCAPPETRRESGAAEAGSKSGSGSTRTVAVMLVSQCENRSTHYPLTTSAVSPITCWSDLVQNYDAERIYDVEKCDEYDDVENSAGTVGMTGIDWFG